MTQKVRRTGVSRSAVPPAEGRTARAAARWPADWLGVTVVAASAIYFASLVHYGFNLGEDGDVVYLIYRTVCGQRPYIDFATAYTPGFFYVNAALLRLFGVNVMVIRWSLVFVNSLAVFGVYRLSRAVVPSALAVVPALGYAALMLVFPGEYATFNVPYPAWYVVLAWAASTLALVHGVAGRRTGWLWGAGVVAGVGFAFKPNTGAFNLAALTMTLLFCSSPSGRGWQRLLWWGLLGAVMGSVAAVFHFQPASRDARLLLWPVLALGAVCGATAGRAVADPLRGTAFARALTALLGGFAIVTLPWLVHYWTRLGTERFLRDVLFIGAGHEIGFYMPIRDLGVSDVALVVASLTVLLAVKAAGRVQFSARRMLLPATILAGAAVVTLFFVAPMPEGFSRAALQRLQHLSFGAALVAHWAAVGFLGRLLFARPRGAAREEPIEVIAVAVSAPIMFLSIYPRSDFFHWLLSTPPTLVLAVLLYWRVVRRASAAGRPFWAAVPAYVLIALFAWTGVRLGARVVSADGGSMDSLRLDRAPVVLESGRRRRLEDLRRATEYITHNSSREATLLGFPDLQLLNFLSGRHVPGRYGSFHPGWPDHVIEAEVVNELQAQQTPLVVMTSDVQLFIAHAPLYYFLLRTYVRQHYELAARIGSYDILRRHDSRGIVGSPLLQDESAGASDVAADASNQSGGDGTQICATAVAVAERTMPESAASLVACWRLGDAAPLQQRALEAARVSDDPAALVPLAEALRGATLAPRSVLLAVRVIGELADASSLPALLSAREVVSGRVRDELDTALFNIASRSLLGRFMFIPHVPGEDAVRADAASSTAALAWLSERPGDPRLRYTAAWIAGVRAERAAIPNLQQMVADPDIGLRTVAADALIRMDVADGVIEPLLSGLSDDDMFLPSIVLSWCQHHPQRAREVLTQTFRRGNPKQRETVAFIAGALGDPAVGEVIAAGVTDPAPRVRIASIWASGVLGIDAARTQIEAAMLEDPREQVRRFAQRSLEWMKENRQLTAEG